jgi:hypothetical protein
MIIGFYKNTINELKHTLKSKYVTTQNIHYALYILVPCVGVVCKFHSLLTFDPNTTAYNSNLKSFILGKLSFLNTRNIYSFQIIH